MIVKKRFFSFTKEEIQFTTESGYTFDALQVAYETYGRLNRERDNAILVLHALTGDAHAAGFYTSRDPKPGWWDPMIGPGRALDTDKYFVICSNVLGGCGGTTGPTSINPRTKAPYGIGFPPINIRDMVRLQKILLDNLGIKKLRMAIGGSMGGMQALEWAVTFPDSVETVVAIAATHELSPLAIAFNYAGIKAIENDPLWRNGNYYSSGQPVKGLMLARMIGTLTYKSDELFKRRFSRKMDPERGLFQVESYLEHQGEIFVNRFDANTYLCLLKAMNRHNIAEPYGLLERALRRIKAKVFMVGIDTDMLYPPVDMRSFIQRLNTAGGYGEYREIKSYQGHDAFLVDFDQLAPIVREILKNTRTKTLLNESPLV
ncbi:homoserine O-acetyltransferase MetX [Thermosediminibacter oceani]|uniref:Homoserine O-acetyltransferase n=1 Tax=Thermosediminibacter oceani (strain ATCC BAA-1034 / DSM 16646 / JW/IW-1228P) TaxID=555079 RepID=D9RYU9_THEOJ|nr:homoserine O-acetyltransferase [Thermosediminibacter oceani]ADL08523.1 homoserine O-acetyltransferase [Thermosediminibacter oceani DSM 16646]